VAGIPTPPSDDDSSSSSSSSSSSTSAPSGPSQAEIAAARNLEVAYRALLSSLGIAMTPNMMKLIRHGKSQGWNLTTFQYYLRKTKDYHQTFPGNVNKDGTVNLSEASYLSRVAQYKEAAASIGMKINPKTLNILIKKGISPSLFAEKASAVRLMRSNQKLFNEFKEYLVATGAAKKPPTKKELLNFAINKGPVLWRNAWDTAYTASKLEEAGIDVGPGDDISFRNLRKNIKQAGADVTETDYDALAEAVDMIPLSKWHGFGLNKDQIAKAFVNPHTAQSRAVLDTLRKVTGTHLAAQEPLAHGQLTQSQTGTQVMTGRRPQQATE
jgi:hypothetical protein